MCFLIINLVYFQDNTDLVFIPIFTMEAVFKIIANGLVLKPVAYLKSGWNILDCIVVVVG